MCTFEFYNHPVKPTKNHQRDLVEFLEKYKKQSISNIKLPELRGPVKIYRPNQQNPKPIYPSESLNFKSKRRKPEIQPSKDKTNLDRMLKNIRKTMEEENLVLKTVSPAMIDQIYRFEALNDIRKVKHI